MGYLAAGAKPDGAAAPSADGATLFSPTTGKKVDTFTYNKGL